MSRLGDIEIALVNRLAQAMISGSPAFETVRGVSGAGRPAIRQALRRERMPAAYVAFTEEPTGPEVRDQVRGARFSILVASGTLRNESDARIGDAHTVGAFQLLETARSQLDDYVPSAGFRLINVQEKFVEADDRAVIYELLYRVWPVITETPTLLYDGGPLVGNDSRMTLVIGPIKLNFDVISFPGIGGVSRLVLGVDARPIFWQGQVRAANHAAMNTIELAIKSRIALQISADITDGNSQVFRNCVLDSYQRQGGRRSEATWVVQEAELLFSQLTPFA